MKIKVKPEGRKDVYIPEKESLKKWIRSKKFKQIHNFIPGGMMIVGADHDVKGVLEDIENSELLVLCILSNHNAQMGHELSVIRNNKLEVYDIGRLTEEDLDL